MHLTRFKKKRKNEQLDKDSNEIVKDLELTSEKRRSNEKSKLRSREHARHKLAHDLVRKNNYRFLVREWVRHEMAPLAVAVVHVKPRYLALTEK